MAMESIFGLMDIHILAHFIRIRYICFSSYFFKVFYVFSLMDMEYTLGMMGLFIKEFGKMIFRMDLERL